MPDALQQLVTRLGGVRRAMIAGAGLLAIVGIYGISRIVTAPTWVPVLSGVALETVGQLTDRLDQAAVVYKLERGGADILVSATDLARARVVLARNGLPNGGRPGLELFDQPSWSMTDFTQRINYRRALEGELERTIGKMRGVEGAQVHLAIHETSTFRSATTPGEASVVLKVRGDTPSREVVEGISHLVASSVDGLTSDNVTIVDDAGRLLSVPNDPGSSTGLSSRQLTIQRDVEAGLETKAEALIGQIVGPRNTRVQVAAAMSFDHLERTTQTMDPEKQVTAQEQKAEIVPGAQGGAASSNVATTYENSKSTETYSNAIGNVKRLTVAVLVNDKQVGTPQAPKFEPRAAAELSRIESLVRSAVGYDSARGDVVTVMSMPFSVPAAPVVEPVIPPTLISRVREYQQPTLNTLALVAAFVIGMMAIRALRVPATAGALASGGSDRAQNFLTAGSDDTGAGSTTFADNVPDRVLAAASRVRDKVATSVDERPEVAARLVRAWMKE
jgi:flagellar M-ring protein FliF